MNESATRERRESKGWAVLSDREHPAMMRGEVASRHDEWRGTLCYVPRHVLATSACVPEPCHVSSSTPSPYMVEFCAFAPPCMVAGPNGLVLKIFYKRVKFEIYFKFGVKIKKNSRWAHICYA